MSGESVFNHYRYFLGLCLFAIPFFLASPTGAVASSIDAKVLSYYEQVLAPKEIRSDAGASAIEDFFSQTRQQLTTNNLERDQILQDLDLWLDQNPYSDLAPRALMLRATIYQENGRDELALLDWIGVKVVFPSSAYASKAKSLARKNIDGNKHKHDKELLESILRSNPKGNVSYRYAALLHLLSGLTENRFRDPLAHAYRVFLANSRSHEMAPGIQLALAENIAMVDPKKAMFQYRTLIAVYPRSSFVPDALLAIADFDQERLQKPEEAVADYKRVIRDYPHSSAARKASLNLAITYERHLRSEEKAIDALKQMVRKYPKTPEASQGGEMLGRLYEKTENYGSAVATYRSMPAISRDRDVIVNSLSKASMLAETKLQDYRQEIEINRQLCSSFPKNDACAEAHYDSGTTYEKKLSNAKLAIAEYQAVVKNFPNHRLAKKSASRINALKGGGLSLF